MPSSPKESLTQKAFGSFFADSIGLVMSQLYTFVIAALLVRKEGAISYGIWAMALQLLTYLNFVDLRGGASLRVSLGTHQHSEDFSFKRRQIGAALITALGTAPLMLAIGVGLASLSTQLLTLPASQDTLFEATFFILVLSTVMERIVGIPAVTLRAVNEEYRLAKINLLTSVIMLSLAVLSIMLGGGLIGLAAATLISTLLIALVKFRIAKKRLHWFGAEAPGYQEVRNFLSTSGWLSFVSLGNSLLMSSPLLLVGYCFGAAAAATYAATLSIVRLPMTMIWKIVDAADAGIADLVGGGNIPRMHRARAEIVGISSALLSILGVLLLPFNAFIIKLWLGQEFESDILLVVVMFLALAAYSLSRVDLFILTNNGNQRKIAVALILSGIVVIGGTIALAPFLNILGVAIAFLLGTATLLLLIWRDPLAENSMKGLKSLYHVALPVCCSSILAWGIGWLTSGGSEPTIHLHFLHALVLPAALIIWFLTIPRVTRELVHAKLRGILLTLRAKARKSLSRPQ